MSSSLDVEVANRPALLLQQRSARAGDDPISLERCLVDSVSVTVETSGLYCAFRCDVFALERSCDVVDGGAFHVVEAIECEGAESERAHYYCGTRIRVPIILCRSGSRSMMFSLSGQWVAGGSGRLSTVARSRRIL